MKKKQFVGAVLILLSITILYGCGKPKVDESVQNVIQQIDAIGEVSLDSKGRIESVIAAYEALTDTQKEQVENRNKLDELSATLYNLEKQHFLSTLDDYSFENVNELETAMDEYWSSFNESEKETALLAFARCSIEKAIENKIKTYLKSPDSFNLYEFEHGMITQRGDEYSTTAKIRFGATNSFGGEITDTVDAIIVHFTIDVANKSVDFTHLSCSTFTRWELGM